MQCPSNGHSFLSRCGARWGQFESGGKLHALQTLGAKVRSPAPSRFANKSDYLQGARATGAYWQRPQAYLDCHSSYISWRLGSGRQRTPTQIHAAKTGVCEVLPGRKEACGPAPNWTYQLTAPSIRDLYIDSIFSIYRYRLKILRRK